MPNTYPATAYRRLSDRSAYGAGFQKGPDAFAPQIGRKPLAPDFSQQFRGPGEMAPPAYLSPALRAAGGIAMSVARRYPLIAALLAAYGLYKLYSWYKSSNSNMPFYNDGWTIGCSSPGGPLPNLGTVSWNQQNGCGANYIVGNSQFGTVLHNTSGDHVVIGHKWAAFGASSWRCYAEQGWNKTGSGHVAPSNRVSYPDDWDFEQKAKLRTAGLARTLDATTMPPGLPSPDPVALPFDVIPHVKINPWRVESEQSERGYDLSRYISVYFNDAPVSQISDDLAPEGAIEVMPNGIKNIPPEHTYSAPPKGTKERKVRMGNAATATVLHVVSMATESLDALYSFYDALPASVRKNGHPHMRPWHRPPPQVALRLLYQNWEQVDMKAAMKNLVVNEVEDQVIGRTNSAIKRTLKDNPYYRGLRGPNVTQLSGGIPKYQAPTPNWWGL